MIFFAEENYFLISYGITLIASLTYYRMYFDTCLRFFPILITYTFLNELLGYLVLRYPKYHLYINVDFSHYTEILYNIYALISFTFFYYVYWKLIKNGNYKKWIVAGWLLVLLSYIVSSFFQDPQRTNLFYATAIGSWVLIFCISLYVLEKYHNHENLIQSKNLMFWFSLALLIFYSVLPILFLIGYTNYQIWEAYHLKTILRIFIIIMYAILTIGFIKGKRRYFS